MTTLRVEGPLLGSICWTDDCGTGSDPMGCVCRLLVPGDDSSFTFPLTERPRKRGKLCVCLQRFSWFHLHYGNHFGS